MAVPLFASDGLRRMLESIGFTLSVWQDEAAFGTRPVMRPMCALKAAAIPPVPLIDDVDALRLGARDPNIPECGECARMVSVVWRSNECKEHSMRETNEGKKPNGC